MFKRIALLLLLFSSIAITPKTTTQPTSALGKVGAGLLKITHRHAYLFTFPVAPLSFALFTDNHRYSDNNFSDLIYSLVAWYFSGRLLKTTTKVIMDGCEIEPFQD